MNWNRIRSSIKYAHRFAEVLRCADRVHSWLTVLKGYLGLDIGYPVSFRTRSGIKISLEDFGDLVTAWVVFCREEYKVPRSGKVILDIGANYGAFSLLAARQAPNAVIVSVEPYPDTYRRLTANVVANGLAHRVHCWNVAVAGHPGMRSMSTAPNIPSYVRGLSPGSDTGSGDTMVSVEAITLGELLDRVRSELGVDEIDLIKMDVEGTEHEILPDLSSDVLSGVTGWQMEYHPSKPKQPLFAALERAGLQCISDIQAGGPNGGVAHFERALSV